MASDWIISALVCICAFLLAIYVYVTRNFSYWKTLGVKELKPTFPFGNLARCVFLKNSFHEFFDEIYEKGKGEKMIGFYVFDKPYLMLRDPELLRCMFIKDFNIFTNKLLCDNKNDPFGTRVLFLSTNPPWKDIRQKMTPMFTSGKLKKNFDLMLEVYKDLDHYLDDMQIDDKIGKPVEIKETCAKVMTDIIGITAYNIRFNSLTDPEAPFRKFGRAFVRSQILRYVQFVAIFFAPVLRKISNATFFDVGTEFFKNTFSHIVDERIKSGEKKNDFVDLIIELTNIQDTGNSNENKVERETWMAQLSGMFVAGFETSSTTTSFAVYLLAAYPEIQKKLRTELLEALDKTNGKLTYEMVTTLPYLDMVVRETLRMYPILPWLDRIPDVDYTFPGTNITVKKGTPIIYPMRWMQMDPKYFSDPEKFDPERFSEQNKNKITPFTYMPFGEGPRNCIGGRLGLLQTKLLIAYLFSKYEVTQYKEKLLPVKTDRINVFVQLPDEVHLNFKKLSI